MILRGIHNIRDVIAFPKTQSGADLMCGAPAPIDQKQLREANIRVVEPPKAPTPPEGHNVVHKDIGRVS
jgi:aspartyl-tRNA synthetase